MKASMGFRTQSPFLTSGGVGRTGVVNAQCSSHVAPSRIHCVTASICAGVSVLLKSAGGMR